MQKNLLILCGLLLMISFPTAQSFGQTWSAPNFHPEIGDKIVKVNGNRVYDESDFRREIRNSPRDIILGVVDYHTGQLYSLRTHLWPASYQTRLGIYIETAVDYDGVIVTGFVPDSPGLHCQCLRSETRRPRPYVGVSRNSVRVIYDGWLRNVDVDVQW